MKKIKNRLLIGTSTFQIEDNLLDLESQTPGLLSPQYAHYKKWVATQNDGRKVENTRIENIKMNKTIKYLPLIFIIIILGCAKTETEAQPKDENHIIQKNIKKGACITTKNAGWNTKINNLNVSWHYSWGSELQILEPDSVEFVPNIWSAWSDTAKVQSKLDEVKVWKGEGKVKYLLGFNEPDGKDQANMSVETALAYWPKLEAVGLPLGSPACVNPTNDWMQTFMNEVEKRNFRVDFVCMHWYGGISVASFLSRLKEVHELYKRPIWITECAP